jgi:3-deoxy-D-arabino-heptulosonate 7-phosphate (DAHP) synthase
MQRDRYEARRGDQSGQWQVWDTRINTVVFGCESMSERAAREYAQRLSEIYRELHPDC